MADWGQFEESADCRGELTASCQVCEAMLPDAVDGTLDEAEQRAFDRHVAGCVVCARELEEAQRGAAWLGMLKRQAPEPAAALLDRILAQTTGASLVAQVSETQNKGAQAAAAGTDVPTGSENVFASPVVWSAATLPAASPRRPVRVATAWQTITGSFSLDGLQHMLRPMLQPRLAMTAAMAFFSVALTLNLTGVRLSTVSAATLHPSTLRRTVADRSAAVVRGFQNMPVVYQTEARMSDLRSDWRQGGGGADDRPAFGSPDGTAPEQASPQPEQAHPQPDSTPAPSKPDQPDKLQGSSRLELSPVAPSAPEALQQQDLTRKGA